MKLSPKLIGLTCLAVWLIFTGLLLAYLPSSMTGRVLGASVFVYVCHILYAGYFLESRLSKLDGLSALYSIIIGICILVSPFALVNHSYLVMVALVLFFAAMLLHQHAIDLRVSSQIDKLARYKIRLEVMILLFISLEALLFVLLPDHTAGIALACLLIMLWTDYVIVFRHQIYRSKS